MTKTKQHFSQKTWTKTESNFAVKMNTARLQLGSAHHSSANHVTLVSVVLSLLQHFKVFSSNAMIKVEIKC